MQSLIQAFIFFLPIFSFKITYYPFYSKILVILFFLSGFYGSLFFHKKVVFQWKNLDTLVIIWFLGQLIHPLIADANADFWFVWLHRLMYLLVYFAFRLARENKWDEEKFFQSWFAGLCIVLLQTAIDSLQTTGKIDATLGNPNILAAFLVFSLPVMFRMIKKAQFHHQILHVAVFFIWLWCFYRTGSWAGGIAFVGVLFLCGWFLFPRPLRLKILLGLGLFCLLIANIPRVQSSITQQIEEDVRPYIWNSGFEMLMDHPVIGVGAGQWKHEYAKYRNPKAYLLEKKAHVTNHSHNAWVEEFCENGIFLGLIWFILPFMAWGSRWKNKALISETSVYLFIAFSALLMTNLFSVNLQFYVSQCWYWVLLALLVPVEKHKLKLELKSFFLIATLIVNFFGFLFIMQQFYLKKAVHFRNQLKWSESIQNYEKSLHFYADVPTMYKLAFAYFQNQDIPNALKMSLAIRDRSPLYAEINRNLGSLYRQLKDFKKAYYFYRIQYQLNPYDEQTLLGLIDINVRLDHIQEAKKKWVEFQYKFPQYPIVSKTFEEILPQIRQ